jgi:Tfp pilus assembly protein PilX
MEKKYQKNTGFAMLFTVLIISIILAIGLGIADLTYKQTLLSDTARDSQLAFYQADSGVECGMYLSLTEGQLPRGTNFNASDQTHPGVPSQYTCGANIITLLPGSSYTDHFVYEENVTGSAPCFSVTFDKTDPVKDEVSSSGFSTCSPTAEQVERGLEVSY